jgi:mRNA interferase MazF
LNYGDVVTVNLGPARGHAQAGSRPAVVVQEHETTQNLRTVVVVPLTSNTSALQRFPYTIELDPDETNGLRVPSVLLVFQITAVDRRSIGSRIGTLSEAHLEVLAQSLRQLQRLE